MSFESRYPVDTEAALTPGVPEVLFEDTCFFRDASYRDFDVTRNGRFLMIKEGSFAAPGQISIVRNWIEELNERVPVN